MSKVDIYNCSLSEDRTEPHGSTVFLLPKAGSMHIEDHGMIYLGKMIMLVKSYKNV